MSQSQRTLQHIPGTKYPVGTRYSNSLIYDEATDEVVFGFQVFRQCLEDGTPTGRKTFIDSNGFLCGIEIAERKREEAMRESAPGLLEALEKLIPLLNSSYGHSYRKQAFAAIAKAKGVSA